MMFTVPLFNFNYDWQYLNRPENHRVKKAVAQLHQFLIGNFSPDFEHLSTSDKEIFKQIGAILRSPENENSAVLFHLVNFHQINVPRSNKAEELSLLHVLCACGRLEDVMWLFDYCPKVKTNLKNHILQTPIQFAVAMGNSPEIATYLLTKGAKVKEMEDDKNSYSLADALHMRWMQSEVAEQFYTQWREVLEYDDVINDIEEKYQKFFEDLWFYQFEKLGALG